MHLRLVLAACLATGFAVPAKADLPGAPKPVPGSLLDGDVEAADIEGRWAIVLLQGNDNEPVVAQLVISSMSASTMQGGFLGAPFQTTAVRAVGKDVIFYAETSDGTGDIIHTGRITGDQITGQSYYTERNQLIPWSGNRLALETN